MKRIFSLLLLAALCACSGEQKPPVKRPAASGSYREYDRLLSRFQPIRFDTLFVYPSNDVYDKRYRYHGTYLDTALVSLLPEDIAAHFPDSVFACYRFPLDKEREALIARVPGTYESTAIRLLVYDRRRHRIEGAHDLADTFGDAGDFAEVYSWLFRDAKGVLQSFVFVPDSYSHEVEDARDTAIDITFAYALLQHKGAVPDTLSGDSTDLLQRYGALLRQVPEPWPQARWVH